MGHILLLDELTINKIAAGEVIERPASVIKEMIENSIDAKATNITIEIRNGGISYIKITDNGKGIAKDDLELAFERHATSKIRCADDLETVTSMGFRGEALASIAAIANVELISKTPDQEIGYKVEVEGGQVLNKEEIGCQTGTTITVRNLFFNTPVRYKFLKKDYTETGYIEDVVTRVALVNPHVAIKLINTGKTILQTSGNGDLKSVIYSIYGRDIAQGIIEVNYDFEDIKITGVIGKPEIARSNRSNQIFFVNKRHIKDKILTAATEQAYKGIIDAGKFGFVVLNIQMPPNKVDVNVHPAKLEVRFQEESKIFQSIFHAIKDSIAKDKAQNDVTTKVDNIIIQSSEAEPIIETIEEPKQKEQIIEQPVIEEKPKTSGFFGWRKNKNEFGTGNNIIEDLYNMKKEDNIVNTSDVLKELKQINENVKKDIEKEAAKLEVSKTEELKTIEEPAIEPTIEEPKQPEIKIENTNLPDGKTYTYIGENKEKIEELLRQLHPETYRKTDPKKIENQINEPQIENIQVAEQKEEYKLEENNIDKTQEIKIEEPIESDDQITQKFDIIKENIFKLDNINEQENNDQPVIEQTIPNREEQGQLDELKELEQLDELPKAIKKPESKPITTDFSKMYEKLFGTPVIKEKTEAEEKQEQDLNAVDIINDNVSVFENIPKYQRPTFKFIGMAFDSYIIAEIEKEMYIINQRTAKEKIVYEKLKNNYYNQVNKDSQMLLLPDIIDLSKREIEIIKENYDILTKAGFSLEEFGENTIKLTGVPTACLDLDTKELFVEILNEINTVARTSRQEKEEKFLATIASKIAQKGSLAISIQEINNLMDELLSLSDPFTYNFEKPIAIKMTKYDIERKFSRK